MALAGAVTVLDLLGAKGHRLRVLIVSDSEYLVRGVREWLPGWMAKGWRRKSGPIENLELWQALAAAIEKHEVTFSWVRGHNGHPKNEYANDLAIGAARNQITSEGAVASPFLEWLAAERKKKRYIDYDPDRAFDQLAALVRSNRVLPLALEHATSGAHAGETP
jgi:ribonuclease HI